MISFPQTNEYAPYYGGYVNQNQPGVDIIKTLENQQAEMKGGFSKFADRGDYRYEPEKWSVKELLGHMIDTERIFAYRALRIARGDMTPLQGFNQDDYIAPGNFENRSMDDLLTEFEAVRASSIAMAKSFDETALSHIGNASGVPVSAKALLFIMTGHVAHHLKILGERYV